MWTIAYEFRCYIAAAVLGLIGLYQPRLRSTLCILTLVILVLNASAHFRGASMPGDSVLGTLDKNVRFLSVFLVGGLYYIFRDKIRLTNAGAAIAALLLIPLFLFDLTAETAFSVFGGYVCFWFGLKAPVVQLKFIGPNSNRDISYGLYLYAWPIQNSIIWCNPNITPWSLCLLSVIGAAVFGYASWTLVEAPALAMLRDRILVHGAGIALRPSAQEARAVHNEATKSTDF
jgi:peptidoglycan/LPS O-acetylase OafA/YrhL